MPVCFSTGAWRSRVCPRGNVESSTHGRRAASIVAGVALAVVAFASYPQAAVAASISLVWDGNTEPSLAGYAVSFRAAGNEDSGVVLSTSPSATVSGLRSGLTYTFSVRAFDQSGLLSAPSNEVTTSVEGPDDERPPSGIEFPGVDLFAAEGAAGLFNYRLALLNTNTSDLGVSVSFLREGDSAIERHYIVPATGRLTVSAADVAGLVGSFGAIISGRPGLIVERTMGWDEGGSMAGAHTAKVITEPSRTWYLAEGNAGFFQTFILLVNPQPSAASARVDFLLDDGGVVSRTYTLGARSRLSVYANEIPELARRSFGIKVDADEPILCERSMYFSNGTSMFQGGHASAAVPAPATHWFLAEGQTGTFFETFVLLANPNPSAVDVTVRYLTASGVAKTERRTLAPTSRQTIVADLIPEIAEADVSFDITSSQPIVVERSMYWPDTGWYGAHNSVGLTELGTEWGLAEGEVGGPYGAESYILLANPGTATASVTATFYREAGRSPLSVTRTVPGGSRQTIAASEAGLTSGERFGAVISSSQPIAVERSIYWNQGGGWGSGTNETGTRIR